MLVITRYRVPTADGAAFREKADAAVDVLARCQGHVRSQLGRNVDDPELWVLATEWINVGAYRRALSSYDVKINAVPLLSRALDEPSAYELLGPDARAGTTRAADADTVGLGEAAQPSVRTDLD